MRKRQRSLFDLITLLRAEPWQTQKELKRKLGTTQKQVWKWLHEIEHVEGRGVDPENGRRNVKIYAIELPADKRNAV